MHAQTIPTQPNQWNLLPIAQTFVPLNALKPHYLEFLLEQGQVEYLYAGQQVFRRGVCDYRHVYLLNGRIRLEYSSGYSESVAAKDSFFPLANEMPRPCDGIAETDCAVLKLDSERLDRILSWSQISDYLLSELSVERDYDEDIGWIKTVLDSNLFYKVPPVNAERILDRMTPQVVLAGEVILRQGEIGNCCYFIKEGAARVTRRNDKGQEQHLADIGVGRCFGEDALVYETLRNATVTMATDGVLMRLEKNDFKLLLLEPQVEEASEEDCQGFADTPVYIDVRAESEYDAGHLLLAANIPLGLLSLKKRLLRLDVPYVFYCDTGRRSRAAAYLLGKQGYNTFALKGGLIGAGMQYQLISDTSYILRDGKVERV
ncbi:cyclic nucleotide-binding protein [Saccharophagus sp. K07]|uniref:cyclic nucleotide-binding domain-containing protein n=1 Tax=Saccharophagus sp. K07 TaxID=2283636 RepID=UPI001651B518|nr:cyclic nucleotide-binding domain-containing protein [Saccharophagus sp. K07]MBC6904793.1 cyclic nucleotide-binding protein [Saccharophagus sp. K07]